MSLEHILLGMLRTPATGYDLRAEFLAGARYFWSAELGQIYPALASMEQRGWLKSSRQPSPKGPQRRIYRRTAQGTRELRRWLASEPIMGTERFAYLAQLIFLGELGDLDQTERFLQQLREKQSALLELLDQVRQGTSGAAQCDSQTTDAEFHEWLCIMFGARAVGARVQWCDEALEIVRRRRASQKEKQK
jgi:DNA-binding PadR family transcriptional regulator